MRAVAYLCDMAKGIFSLLQLGALVVALWPFFDTYVFTESGSREIWLLGVIGCFALFYLRKHIEIDKAE